MRIDAHAYNITIRRGEFEGEILFEARVKELPDLIEYGESYEEAYDLAVDAIETTAGIFAEKGRAMPVPSVPVGDFSGRVTLRLPKSLHRALDNAATEEGVSLNQHLVNVLTYYSGFAAGRVNDSDSPWQPLRTPTPAKSGKQPHLKLVSSTPIEVANGWK